MTTKTEPPQDWDPLPAEREWWRHTGTGDRAYRVRRGGRDMVRLDRPHEELLQELPGDPDKATRGQWARDEYGTLYAREQVARVAFMADRGMCSLLGLHAESRLLWQDLPDQVRQAFIATGPPKKGHPLRRHVYEAIVNALKPDTRI
jgi:hypothetical protein